MACFKVYVLLFFLISATILYETNGARILGLFPMASKSHYILGTAYLKGLAEAGHDVTMVSPFNDSPRPKNGTYREIVLTGFQEKHDEIIKEMQELSKSLSLHNLFRLIYFLTSFGPLITNKTISHPEMQKLIHSNEKFDAVVLVQVGSEALKLLAPHFGGHLITFSTINSNSMINQFICNPAPSSYIPEMMLHYTSNMTFPQRIFNTLLGFLFTIVANFYSLPWHKEIAEQYIPNAAPFYDNIYNISLVLLNSHESLHPAAPHVPVIKNIGGFHVAAPQKLPKDLQDYLDNSKNGAIYFSMGTNVKSKDLPLDVREALLKTFAKLKQNVLWKFEDENISDLPKNVKIAKWLPQQDILAHPNVKLFITHGGLLSTTETIFHGVPILAIPVFGDQQANANKAKEAGYALVLPLTEITEESLTRNLNEILTNPIYRENVQARSKIMKDRETSPLETAIYWTEYVIRHNGAKHLRVAGLNLPWYKYYLLDVFAVIAVFLCSNFVC